MHPKILIYRHDDVVEALMADFLVFCNYEVWPAYCREDALLDIKDQDFDIAIFDLTTLEDLELIQAAQSVKPELVILALTDEHDSTLVKEASLPADQTLVTPLPLVKILRRAQPFHLALHVAVRDGRIGPRPRRVRNRERQVPGHEGFLRRHP